MNKKFQYTILGICLILIVFNIYKNLNNNKEFDINEFGKNYNKFRSENNIPTLPENWILDTLGKNGITNYYNPNLNSLGHRFKYINLLKSEIGAEIDKFYLTNDSLIETRFERNSGNKFIYLHIPSKSTKTEISSQEANNLLEKKSIDFRFNESWNSKK